ncbi:MAG TPA: T9SS type A sorting domain-containing protein [Bacteroidia bacterium]|nr:T9SS type A sorting domain-containing protein [Bacteroidia bacterium]
MKKIYTLLASVSLFSALSLNAQTNCNAGYESPVFPNTMNIPSNTAFAIRVTAASAGTLTDLCMYNSGVSIVNMKMAVYDDNGGVPGNLVASTGSFALTNTPGAMVVPVTPVNIIPGDYYLTGVIDASASPIAVDNTTSVTIFAMSLPFSSSFPATGTSFSTAPGNPVNIWMNITCSTSGIQETVGAHSLSMNGYPVPAHDVYSMSFHSTTAMKVVISLYNSNGQKVSESEEPIGAGESKIDLPLNGLAEGLYFLRITNEAREVLISKSLVRE